MIRPDEPRPTRRRETITMQPMTLPDHHHVHGGLPLYGSVRPLTPARHGTMALAADRHFGFAAAAPTIPVTIDEFDPAALDYPIVFFGPTRRALAVTGLTPDRNFFVDNAGDWRRGAYVPAYLRRHPFTLARDGDSDRWIACVDEQADQLLHHDSAGAEPLFDGTEPTARLAAAVAFCEAYLAAEQRTERFVQLLDDLDLFEPRQAHYHPPSADGASGDPILLLDYVAISRTRLAALPDDAVLRLNAAGALGPIHLHLLSDANWARLGIDPD